MKKNFIYHEIFGRSYNAAVQRSQTYKKNAPKKDRIELQRFLKNYLEKTVIKLYKNKVYDQKHLKVIEEISNILSEKFSSILYQKRFRIGTSQKILNLYLKYLWSLDIIKEPPHMPIDNIILQRLKKLSGKNSNSILDENWTKLDSIEKYSNIIQAAKKIITGSISEWELKEWLDEVEYGN